VHDRLPARVAIEKYFSKHNPVYIFSMSTPAHPLTLLKGVLRTFWYHSD
jgi:hypothetical protein